MSVRSIAIALPLLICAGCAGGPGGAAGGAAAPAAAPTSAQAGGTTLVAIAPPAAPGMTLPEFLGLKALGQYACAGAAKVHDCITDIFPSLKSIPSPDELGPDADPGSQAAAEIQQDEAAAADKAAALMYLSSVGCGCYPGVEEAFLSALDDCNEFVRFTAAQELRRMTGKDCGNCRTGQCCSAALQKKLGQLGYEMDDNVCPIEPSPRVRRMARLALAGCGGLALVDEGAPTEAPTEGPSREDLPPSEPEEIPPQETSVMRSPGQGVNGGANEESTADSRATVGGQVQPAAYASASRGGVVLARVGGTPIHENTLKHRIGRRVQALATSMSPAKLQQLKSQLYSDALADEIRVQLLIDEARRHWTPAEVAQRIEASQSVIGGSPDQDQRLADAWLQEQAAASIAVGRDEVLRVYETQQDRFWQPEMVRWESVRVPVGGAVSQQRAESVAEHIRLRLMGAQAPSPNLDLTIANSDTHGWTVVNAVSSTSIAQLLSSLPVGRVGPIVRDENGFHIVRVLQRRPTTRLPLQAVEAEIRSELVAAKTPEFARAYVAELQRRANVWSVFDGMSREDIRKAVTATTDALDSTSD